MARDAYHPNTFFKPSGITETLLYKAAVRIPFYALPGAKGTPTPMNIRVSVGSAGTLMMSKDSNGHNVWSVALRDKQVDR